jgi:hypothetical protein
VRTQILHHFLYIAEAQWVELNHFTQEAGLELVACLNILQRVNGVWDSRNSLDLIAFSDEMGYNVAWELGYGTEHNTVKFMLDYWTFHELG